LHVNTTNQITPDTFDYKFDHPRANVRNLHSTSHLGELTPPAALAEKLTMGRLVETGRWSA